ncbi:UdgX family uracil-DNA binding protein [Micromonospora aurantiaca (nom. illeg.)]|uniref:UdgX family uracil-DNA binding protein n=1 Tax=Micromonospora aurantiaca (nom. illeg.) TaxID=47850 RepID=UPI00082856B6|nr:UdgX family uracil-DNA binding protein [Micromonospora aurantiaca]MBC9005806.1 UdgX family uracil-DNA binding protein [Micromonospora aurantiaca]SCL33953.1 DNA polymerase [Micromonospora aurantiaca]
MAETESAPGAQDFIPPSADTIDELRAAAGDCRGCELYRDATQTVFGRGDEHARVVFVGEQPGDIEDQKGLPFVGPAGRLLRKAVDDAALDPAQIYLTNAVKHFRFELRGRRRIHQTPDRVHVTACRPWLVAEFARLRPEIVVVLGATAAKALLGPSFRVTKQRGELLPWPAAAQHPEDFERVPVDRTGTVADAPAARLLATIHPSAVLRADNQDVAYEGLVADLKVAAKALKK